MTLKITCPICNRSLNVNPSAYGKTLPCPGCGGALPVPLTTTQARPLAAAPAAASLHSATTFPVPHRGVPPVPGSVQSGAGGFQAVAPPEAYELPIRALRHPKESTYFAIAATLGVLGWVVAAPLALALFWVVIPIFLLTMLVTWYLGQLMKADLLGNSIVVSQRQYPEVFEIVEQQCRALGLAKHPTVFIHNGGGAVNAIALRLLRDRYVLLLSDLVDVMLASGSTSELSFVIGHELGHHAAGHTAWWKNVLLKPARLVPFLGGAYSRACELTADRIGMYLCGKQEAACRGLAALACGSKMLSPKTDLQAFTEQEHLMPGYFAHVRDIYSSHPRLTRRVLALGDAASLDVFQSLRL